MSSFPVAATSADIYQDSHLLVNFQTEVVRLDGRLLKMAPKEFEILACLVRHARELVTRGTLLEMIWGYGPGVRTRTFDVHLRRLRQSLEPYGKSYIETVFNSGYRFQPCPGQRTRPAALPTAAHSRRGDRRRHCPIR